MAPSVSASGVDTVRFVHRLPGVDLRAVFGQLGYRHGSNGSILANSSTCSGSRVVAWPSHGLLAHEGRLAELLLGRGDHSLGAISDVPVGAEIVRDELVEMLCVDPGAGALIGRLDLAADIDFDAPSEGLAFLRSLRGICPPRARITTETHADGSPMCVYVRTPKRGTVLARAYDKGRETGAYAAGERVRIEAQIRLPSTKRCAARDVEHLDAAVLFGRTWRSYTESDEIVVAGPDGATAHLVALMNTRRMTYANAERLAGTVQILKHVGRAAYHDPAEGTKANSRRSARRLKALRDAGIALEYELGGEVVVPTSELLRAAIASFSA
jgi:hypothetical protein